MQEEPCESHVTWGLFLNEDEVNFTYTYDYVYPRSNCEVNVTSEPPWGQRSGKHNTNKSKELCGHILRCIEWLLGPFILHFTHNRRYFTHFIRFINGTFFSNSKILRSLSDIFSPLLKFWRLNTMNDWLIGIILMRWIITPAYHNG